MSDSENLPWPPSLEALGSSPAERPSGQDQIDSVRRQHRELASLLLDLIEAIKSPATPPEDRIHLGRRIRLELEFLSQVLENHRDQEESVLFVTLHSQRPELGPTLDQMGEEHVRIFRNLRTISEEADQLGLDPGPTADALSGFIPSLRGFIEELWKHTIDEETMLHRCRQEQRGPGPDRSDQIRDV